jgi:HPt (histidine-containing phosphotransfer) domain-containing protein
MTAHAMMGDRERCLEAGMDGYVSKPMQSKDLLDVMERLLRPSAGDDGGLSEEPVEDVDFDRAGVMQRVGGDLALLGELAELFVGECEHFMATTQEAIAQRDAAALERAAHTVKGSAGNIGAPQVVEAALRLETMARQGDWTEADTACAALETALNNLKPALMAITEGGVPETGEEGGGASASGIPTPSKLHPPVDGGEGGAGPWPVLDWAELQRRVGGDRKLLTELVALFVEAWPQRLSDLRAAVERGDSDALERAAHAAKGSVGTFATRGAFESARRLEEMGRAGDMTGAGTELLHLEQQVKSLISALEQAGGS